MMTGLVRPTKKQRQLLDYIEAFIAEHGYSPSYREIMTGCQYNSVATVALHVGNLIKRGHLRKREHSARSLEVVPDRQEIGVTDLPTEVAEGHEEWLTGRIEAFISQLDAGRVAEGRVLLDALRLLGMTEQAAGLESYLVGQRADTNTERIV